MLRGSAAYPPEVCIPRGSRLENASGRVHLRTKRAGLAKPEKLNEGSWMAGRTGLEPGGSSDKPPES